MRNGSEDNFEEDDDLECHYAMVSVYQTQNLLNNGKLYLDVQIP